MHNRSIICAVDRKYTVKDIHRCIHAVMALTAVVLLLLVFAASSLLQVKADEEKYQYNNVDTGYEAVIEDDADIIDESNYSSLLDIMKQITVYGNVMLKTIDTNSTTTESYVRSLYREKYGTDSGTIFIIDMYNRNIWIHSNGKIYSTVTSSYADTITDNVYRYASSKDYYMCAYKVYEQELALLKGRRISQPMKYISNAKYGKPVESGTIYRGDNKRLDICVHTLCGCGETLYMNCKALNIYDRKLNSTSVMSAINEAQSLTKQELDLLSKELNAILNSEIEISRY